VFIASQRVERGDVSRFVCVCDSVKEVVCFGEGAGANILARFAVSF